MLKNINVNLDGFMDLLDKCSGNVYVVTDDGDRLNLKSKLSQLVGIMSLIEDGQVKIDTLVFDSKHDESLVFRYLIYGHI